MAQWSDEELVASIRKGSEDAFAQLVVNYTSAIRKLTSRCRNPWMDADDLAQEALLGLLSATRHYNGNGEFRSFAFVCMRHRILSAIRRGSKQPEQSLSDLQREEEFEKAPASITDNTDPAQVLLRRESEKQLIASLHQSLTDLEYHVLMLYLSAYSYEEMAGQLGVSTKSVDNALQRIRKKLSVQGFKSMTR